MILWNQLHLINIILHLLVWYQLKIKSKIILNKILVHLWRPELLVLLLKWKQIVVKKTFSKSIIDTKTTRKQFVYDLRFGSKRKACRSASVVSIKQIIIITFFFFFFFVVPHQFHWIQWWYVFFFFVQFNYILLLFILGHSDPMIWCNF